MGIQINGSTDTISAVDGSLSLVGGELRTVSGLNVSGVATATTFIGDLQVSTGSTVSGSTNVITASTNGSERVRITSSGNVGIGTDTPYSNASFNTLSVGGSGKYGLIELVKSNGVAGSWIDSHGTAGDGNLRFTTAGTSGAITFWTGGEFTEKARIDSSGNIGIATTSPRQKLTFGSLTASSTSTPDCIDLGATYSGTNASNLKLKLYTDGSEEFGFGASVNSRLDYVVPSNGNHVFYRSSTESARIDSSGRLLVGTSSARTNFYEGLAATVLQAETTGGIGEISGVRNENNQNGATLVLAKSRGTTVGSNTLVQNGDELGGVYFQANDGTNFIYGALVQAFVDGAPGTNDMPTRLVFSTTADGASSPTERMRIQADGNVLIGTSNHTTIKFGVVGADSTSSNFTYYGWNSFGTATFAVRNDGGFFTGLAAQSPYNLTIAAGANTYVNSNGYLYRATSSGRYKTNIETLENSYADAILNVRPVWFRSIAPGDAEHPDWGYWGFIAEEVAEIDPRLVHWKTHDYSFDENNQQVSVELDEPIAEGVQYDRFVPHLLNLIKRQKEQIESQGAAIAALETEKAEILARLDAAGI